MSIRGVKQSDDGVYRWVTNRDNEGIVINGQFIESPPPAVILTRIPHRAEPMKNPKLEYVPFAPLTPNTSDSDEESDELSSAEIRNRPHVGGYGEFDAVQFLGDISVFGILIFLIFAVIYVSFL